MGPEVALVIPSRALSISLKLGRRSTSIASKLVAIQEDVSYRKFASVTECVVILNPGLDVEIIPTF